MTESNQSSSTLTNGAFAWHSYKAIEIDGKYYNTSFIKEVIKELSQKAFYVERGFAEFSKVDMLVLHILKESNRINNTITSPPDILQNEQYGVWQSPNCPNETWAPLKTSVY